LNSQIFIYGTTAQLRLRVSAVFLAPLLQFEKPEIHTGFLRFPNFELGQRSYLRLLAEFRGTALL
jgi:hypothetical protein